VNPISIQCRRCGALKVDGVHHCSKCNKCVYKMDHHCPWTDNCVGYINIKPFMLFLFYAALLSLYGVLNVYHMAYRHELRYISLMNLLPTGAMPLNHDVLHLLHAVVQHQADPTANVTLTVPPGGFFSSSPLASVRSALDFLTFFGITALFVYCIFILGMVGYLIGQQSSMVERMKCQAEEAAGKRCKTPKVTSLTFQEWFHYVFDEDISKPTLTGLLRALVPIVDSKTRSMALVSKAYLEKAS